MKNKLSQRTKQGVGEEGLLLRSLKFFDVGQKGILSKEQFVRAIEKIGVVVAQEVS